MQTTVEHEPQMPLLAQDIASAGAEHPPLADDYAVPGFDAVAHLAAASLGVAMVSLVLDTGSAYWYSRDPAAGQARSTAYFAPS